MVSLSLVAVLPQPSSPAQTCAVTAGSGLIANAAVTDVAVTCTTHQYKICGNAIGLIARRMIGGTVIGLMGSGLTLRNSGGDDLVIAANGPFQFATSVLSGAAFAVTIAA